MSQLLPYDYVKIDNTISLDKVLKTADENNIGYIVECDLKFPKHLLFLAKC